MKQEKEVQHKRLKRAQGVKTVREECEGCVNQRKMKKEWDSERVRPKVIESNQA